MITEEKLVEFLRIKDTGKVDMSKPVDVGWVSCNFLDESDVKDLHENLVKHMRHFGYM